jgi:signal transduction histidine kinase
MRENQGVRARRFTRGDVLFFVAFGIYTLAAIGTLLLGAGAAVASVSKGFHDKIELWSLHTSFQGRVAEGMLKASEHTQPAFQLAIDYGFSLFNLALAGFLVWLRPRDPTARRLAVGMVGTAAVFNLQAHSVYEAMNVTRAESAAHFAFQFVAAVSYLLALLRFPDGKLVPRWRPWALALLYGPLAAGVTYGAFRVTGTSRTVAVILYFGILIPLVGVVAQAYRYRRSPTPIERQQSRLVFWAMLPALLVSLISLTGIQSSAFSTFQNRPIDVLPVALFRVFQPVFALIPLALFVGILRYRLWNIDRVISRSLMYGLLAGFVSAVYVGFVVGIGRAIGATGGRGNLALSIVATGVIAFAFQPVKEWVNKLANRLVYGKRATPYEVLSSLGNRMSTTVATEELLPLLARIVAEGTGATRADVWLVRGEQAWPAASWPEDHSQSRAAVSLTGTQFPVIASASAVVPVRHDEELLGALTVVKPGGEQLSPTEDKLLHDVASQAGLVLRNVRLTTELLDRLEELRASRQRLVAAQDAERRRLERNLHDGAQQQLVALKVQLGLAERMADGGQNVAELLRQLKDDTGEALENLRDLARGIYPPLLAAEGLPAAVASHARKTSLDVEVAADGIGRYPQDIETAVYFCVLEALQNASKYAGECKVNVSLGREAHALVFTVHDNGPGFDPATTPKGAGSQNMADRVAALDGVLTITSSPGQGTTVTGKIPTADLADADLADVSSAP